MKFTLAVFIRFAIAPFLHLAAAVPPVFPPPFQLGHPVLGALFGINFGRDSDGNVLTWISGQSKCIHFVLGPQPCNNPFSFNGQTFTLQGCGGPLSVRTSSGALFANCGVLSEVDECGVHSDFHGI